MVAPLSAIEVTVSAGGIGTLAEPITGPCTAVLALLVEDWLPNARTKGLRGIGKRPLVTSL